MLRKILTSFFSVLKRLERLDSVNAWVASYVTATKTNDRPGKESDLGAALDSLLPDNLDNKWGFRVSSRGLNRISDIASEYHLYGFNYRRKCLCLLYLSKPTRILSCGLVLDKIKMS